MLLRSVISCILLCLGLVLANSHGHEVESPNELEQAHDGHVHPDEVPLAQGAQLMLPQRLRWAVLFEHQSAPPCPDPSLPLHVPKSA